MSPITAPAARAQAALLFPFAHLYAFLLTIHLLHRPVAAMRKSRCVRLFPLSSAKNSTKLVLFLETLNILDCVINTILQ